MRNKLQDQVRARLVGRARSAAHGDGLPVSRIAMREAVKSEQAFQVDWPVFSRGRQGGASPRRGSAQATKRTCAPPCKRVQLQGGIRESDF